MTTSLSPKRLLRVCITSTCPDYWGGSEELWWGAATILAEQGHAVSVFKTRVDASHPKIQRLQSLSCKVRDLERAYTGSDFLNPFMPARYKLDTARKQMMFLAFHWKLQRPDLVIVSQGANHDGLPLAQLCYRLGLPYVIVSQKASDQFWPADTTRDYARQTFESAIQCFFVSRHNQHLTEDQIGCLLSNATVVRNPYQLMGEDPLPWPGNEEHQVRLACVARLFLQDKGQDILIRVLANYKWRQRNLHVTFFGQGENLQGLVDFAEKLGVQNVTFAGHSKDISTIWKEHHALVLPSRSEGLPLALVEAMMCGRPAIVTDVGGNTEVLEDEVTGFVAAGAFVEALDEALERAWVRRTQWRTMGEIAARNIRELVPTSPTQEFVDYVLKLCSPVKSSTDSKRRNYTKVK